MGEVVQPECVADGQRAPEKSKYVVARRMKTPEDWT
jgi:hypothetical protein